MVVLWIGPVQASTLELARWPSPAPQIVTIGAGANGGIGSNAFAQLGIDYRHRARTPLRGALEAHGVDPDTNDRILVCGFSAAHGLIETILNTPADRERVSAVGAFDAYYTGAAGTPKPGYRAFAELAANGARSMVMTSSNIPGGVGLPTGADAAGKLLAGLGLEFIPPRNIGKAVCERAEGRGNLAWYVYADRDDKPDPTANAKATHVQHATVLAPVFAPEIAGAAPRIEGASSSGAGKVALAIVVAWIAFEVARAA